MKRTVLLITSAVWLLILVAFLLSPSSAKEKEKPTARNPRDRRCDPGTSESLTTAHFYD